MSGRLCGMTLGALVAAILGAWLLSGRSAPPVGVASAASPTTQQTLTVTGHGEVTQAPDMAQLTLGVQTRGSDAQEALSKNAATMNAVIAAIYGQGVPSNHVQTDNISLGFDQQRAEYTATHDLRVKVDNVSKVGAVLDAAVAAGANRSWGVAFGLKDVSAAQGSALQAAIADARKRADSMAGALHVTITGVSKASDQGYSSPPIKYGGVAAPVPAASTPVQTGELTVSENVDVVYTYTQ